MFIWFLKLYWRLALNIFYRRIEVQGLEHLPEEGPVLLTSNHVNALIDPLVIMVRLRRPLTMTMKNTLSQNWLLGFLIRRTGSIMFHRAMDKGRGSIVAANAASLAECRKRLTQGAAICIFPEGESHSASKMKPLKNGVARIALDYLEQDGNAGGLKIVPVGLHYEAKDRFRSAVFVRFGEALDVAKWKDQHFAGQASSLTAEIERGIHQVTLNFEHQREAFLLNWAAEVLGTRGEAPPMLGQGEKSLPKHVGLVSRVRDGYLKLQQTQGEEVAAISARVHRYRARLRLYGITQAEVFIRMSPARAALFVLRELELLLVGLPLAAFGWLHHMVPLMLIRWYARRITEHRDQWSSNVIFPAMIVFPVLYLLLMSAAWLLLPKAWPLVYSVLLPYGGWYMVNWADRVGGSWQRMRTFLQFLARPALQQELVSEGREIIGEIQRLGSVVEAEEATKAVNDPLDAT